MTAPSSADDDAFVAAYARLERMAASPGLVAGVLPMAVRLDVRNVLETISVPTLVIHRAEAPMYARSTGNTSRSTSPARATWNFPEPTTWFTSATPTRCSTRSRIS